MYILPGLIEGCSNIDSLLRSTLECTYSRPDCVTILTKYMYGNTLDDNEYPWWIQPDPLIYDPTLSSFPPNTSISMIVKNIMIEQWNPSISYNDFYESCAPTYCTYSKRVPAKTFFGVIVMLVSMIGGLTMSLRLITPQLVKICFRLWKLFFRRQQQQQPQQQQQRGNC